MAGKAIVRGNRRVAYVIDKLSKNTLADIILDRIRAEIGDEATDEQIIDVLQRWLSPMARMRGDKILCLSAVLGTFDRINAAYAASREVK